MAWPSPVSHRRCKNNGPPSPMTGSPAPRNSDQPMVEAHQPLLLLTNDDGIDAPGLRALWQAVQPLGRCLLIAPAGPVSGCGHQVTTHLPIRVERRAGDAWAVAGTPVDCVRLALHRWAPEPDWVFSGVNAG